MVDEVVTYRVECPDTQGTDLVSKDQWMVCRGTYLVWLQMANTRSNIAVRIPAESYAGGKRTVSNINIIKMRLANKSRRLTSSRLH